MIMGTVNSKLDEDKGLQLCRTRKKFIREALNGRCSLALAHIAYTEHLKVIGSALSRFAEPDFLVKAFPNSSGSSIPVQHVLIEKPADPSSVQSQSPDAAGNMLVAPAPQVPSRFQSNAMNFGGSISFKVEEKPPVVATITSTDAPEVPQPWDYFGLFHQWDEQQMRFAGGFESSDGIRQLEEEEGMPELEDVDEKLSSHGIEDAESQASGDEFEFEEPPPASLVRSFRNVATDIENAATGTKLSSSKNVKETKPDIAKGKLPAEHADRKNDTSIDLDNANENCEVEETVQPKDFFSSINDIEQLFVKASESGKEVPQMLEANKFHFRLVKDHGLVTSFFLKPCFPSCGKDLSELQQEAPPSSMKYLTWHRTRSSRSSSSQNPLLATDINEPNGNLFDNSCMLSGSHASTLDRLYVWEKKLFDEVKAGQVLRAKFDKKCKILRQKESQGKSTDKMRAAVKDLHSRIYVAIHRIDSISKKIEEIRDSELQPQLEELIEGLRKMWEIMARCHKLQFHIISTSHIPGNIKIKPQLETTAHLENELASLSPTFTKWISTQRAYVEAIDKWLFKCILLPQIPTRRNKRMKPPPIRNCGPPIYMMCGTWLEMIDQLPLKVVIDSANALAAELARLTPRQDKNSGNGGISDPKHHLAHEDPQMPNLDQFRATLARFLQQLDKFAESSVKMLGELQKGIQEAKWSYQLFKSQHGSLIFR